MATRREVEQRRTRLQHDLRQACGSGRLRTGELIPPIRELAAQYQLSPNVVRQALQRLLDEGVLYTVPGVGTFAGRRTRVTQYFLRVSGDGEKDESAIGFAERIARSGGASLSLPYSAAREYAERDELPPLAGFFGPSFSGRLREIPRVTFAGHVAEGEEAITDVVSYDDREGGRQAAGHLLELGHRRIAYLAMHRPTDPAADYNWSAERETGWRETLVGAGVSPDGLSFYPPQGYDRDDLSDCGRQAARALAAAPDITAVVAANDAAAMGLLETLRRSGVPLERWPAIVGFDNLPDARGQILTSLQLPAHSLGAAAAELLWERWSGLLTGHPVHRRVRMVLLPRLTSRAGWSVLMESAAVLAAGKDRL